MNKNACIHITLPDDRPALKIILDVNPAAISTAQQKKIDFKHHLIFTDKRVAQGMKTIYNLARPFASSVASLVPHGHPAFLSVAFFHAYPQGTPKHKLIEGVPMTAGADNDNRIKAPQDALVRAGFFSDDRFITSTHITKRRTIYSPRIEIVVANDI